MNDSEESLDLDEVQEEEAERKKFTDLITSNSLMNKFADKFRAKLFDNSSTNLQSYKLQLRRR